MQKQNQKGITLIALIITIIVMLILVGVTINVALNGGVFSKAEEAGSKTKIAQIQEALTIKKAEVLAEYDGKIPEDYGITIDKLNLPEQLKTEYGSKLIISKDGKLYYDTRVVTNVEEEAVFKSMGIQDYSENNSGTGTPKFYGVAYSGYTDGPINFYFFNDGIVLISNGESWSGYSYTKDENQLTIMGMSAIVSEDYNTITIEEIGTCTRNENLTIDWDKEYAPVMVSIASKGYSGGYEPSLSNSAFQEKGEYKTTIIIGEGKYNVADCSISFTLMGGKTLKEYKEGEDYSYNTSTGEIVIFNLTEPVMMDISV